MTNKPEIKPYFDSILLYCLIQEFQNLKGQKLKSLQKDRENNIYLSFGDCIFFASTHPSFYRVHLLPRKRIKDLRKHPFEDYIRFSNVIEIKQLGLDRIFYIHFSKSNSASHHYLLFELMGPSSNVYLLNSNKNIILQHKKTTRNKKGEKYSFIPVDISYSAEEQEEPSAKETLKYIMDAVSPITIIEKRFKKLPEWLKEIISKKDEQQIKKNFSSIIKNPKPYILYENVIPLYISPSRIKGKAEKKESFSTAVAELYDYFIEEERKKRIKRNITKEIKNREKILKRLQLDSERSESSEEFKKKAELILVNLKKIKKGIKKLHIEDPYNKSNFIEIEINPTKSPIKNAEEYFKKHRKAKKSKKIIEQRKRIILEETKNLKKYIEGLNELNSMELKELESQFLTKRTFKEKTICKKKFRRLLTRRGKTVLIGRNRYENEELTFGTAKLSDLFFHIREAPGSHTILINDGKLAMDDIVDAARIAAHFSKAQHSTIVPVSYTERRFVRRSRKLGPGKVMLTKEKTIFVKPEIPSRPTEK